VSDKLREIAAKMDALARRMDAREVRHDAAKSGTKMIDGNEEFVAGVDDDGFEVVFKVPVTYSFELGEPVILSIEGGPSGGVKLDKLSYNAKDKQKIRSAGERAVKRDVAKRATDYIHDLIEELG
jgi:hypothetical protein